MQVFIAAVVDVQPMTVVNIEVAPVAPVGRICRCARPSNVAEHHLKHSALPIPRRQRGRIGKVIALVHLPGLDLHSTFRV